MITREQSYALIDAANRETNEYVTQAYHRIVAVANSRIDGKRHAPRRPACGIKMTVGEGFIDAEFKPELVNSPGGWTVGKVYMLLKTPQPGKRRPAKLKIEVKPDGKIRGKSWTIHTAESLLTIARHLLALLAKGEAYLLAAADADQCAICGRGLTDPHSREAGIGPECIEHVYRTHRPEEKPTEDAADLAARIKDIRAQIQRAHPDRGGDGDGELFARLTRELDQLRELQRRSA